MDLTNHNYKTNNRAGAKVKPNCIFYDSYNENGEPTGAVTCTLGRKKCSFCGWNPTVSRARLMENFNYKMKLPNEDTPETVQEKIPDMPVDSGGAI